MADKPIREQSALELLETYAEALQAENARLLAENKLHRDFLVSIIEYHDYGDDNVAFEDICKAIEKRAQQLDRQLAVSVHEIESNSVETEGRDG